MTAKRFHLHGRLNDEQGVSLVFIAISLVMLISFAALAVDIGYLYVVRNELQNAADAGALAGASELYNDAGTAVNPGANQVAYNIARANTTGGVPVEVNWTSGNEGDIQRGHYSFTTGQFTPNDSLDAIDLWEFTEAQLDVNTDFINAVRVITRRNATPAFFSRIFGHDAFALSTHAVAYIGFAGTLMPGEADQPIAICEQAIRDEGAGKLTCGVGRMLNSGSNPGHETGGWTNFSQPCVTASTSTVKPLVCASGNPDMVTYGKTMGTTNGEEAAAFNDLVKCWKSAMGAIDVNGDGNPDKLDSDGDGWPDQPWKLTLPVIKCTGNNVSNCSEVRGAVVLDVLWITQQDKNQFKEVPKKMWNPNAGESGGFWTCTEGSTGQQCWDQFRTAFNLQDILNNSQAFYEDKTIYFMPDCSEHSPAGRTGGENFGVLAEVPVLVQ